MFDGILGWAKNAILSLMKKDGQPLLESQEMESLISLWAAMYGETGCMFLGIPATVSAEFARLVTLESEIRLTGPRGEWMNEQLLPFWRGFRPSVEYACALGGMVFKPYVQGEGLAVDVVQADCFFPTAFDWSGELTGAVFVERLTRDGKIYTRLESHSFSGGSESIRNRAFVSGSSAALGGEIGLDSVPEWAEILPQAEISGLSRPLFSYFRIPFANQADRFSPLGVSVFSRAVGTIRQADAQFGRLLWEYEGGQLAIDVDEAAVRKNRDGSVSMDQTTQRLYRRGLNLPGGNLYQAFAPALRDASYRAGLNSILREIETQCSLSFGTLSDPEAVAKTATEMKISRQRSFAAVKDIQTALQSALDGLFYAMDRLAAAYGLGSAGGWEAAYQWHDSILTDEEADRRNDRDDALNGFLPKWQYNVRWHGMTEEEARQAVADAAGNSPDPFGLGGV